MVFYGYDVLKFSTHYNHCTTIKYKVMIRNVFMYFN